MLYQITHTACDLFLKLRLLEKFIVAAGSNYYAEVANSTLSSIYFIPLCFKMINLRFMSPLRYLTFHTNSIRENFPNFSCAKLIGVSFQISHATLLNLITHVTDNAYPTLIKTNIIS